MSRRFFYRPLPRLSDGARLTAVVQEREAIDVTAFASNHRSFVAGRVAEHCHVLAENGNHLEWSRHPYVEEVRPWFSLRRLVCYPAERERAELGRRLLALYEVGPCGRCLERGLAACCEDCWDLRPEDDDQEEDDLG